MKTKILIYLLITIFFTLPETIYSDNCPKRIVSLTLASDDILYEIVGDKKRIVGVTYLAHDPSISNIADRVEGKPGIYANLEQIISLNPDLTIVSKYMNQDSKRQILNAGINVLFLDNIDSFESIKNNIMKIGNSVCETKNAMKLITQMENHLLEVKVSDGITKNRPKILFYSSPGFTSGGKSTIDEIIEYAGGINLGADIGNKSYENVSFEYIIEKNPDVILLSSYNPSSPDFDEKLISNPILANLEAIRNKRVIVIPGKYITSASHYATYAVKELSEKLNLIYKKIDKPN